VDKNFKDNVYTKDIKKVVSFDRKGEKSIITHQIYSRSCSDKFADALSNEYNKLGFGLSMEKDKNGSATDSASFMDNVPECTNISVGYYNEHTNIEKQNISFLHKISEASILVNWENLPIERDCDVDEYEVSPYSYKNYRRPITNNTYSVQQETFPFLKRTLSITNKIEVDGHLYHNMNHTTIYDRRYFLSDDRIEAEKKWILEAISRLNESPIEDNKLLKYCFLKYDLDYDDADTIYWDGRMLWITDIFGKVHYCGDRDDIEEIVSWINHISNESDFIEFSRYQIEQSKSVSFSQRSGVRNAALCLSISVGLLPTRWTKGN